MMTWKCKAPGHQQAWYRCSLHCIFSCSHLNKFNADVFYWKIYFCILLKIVISTISIVPRWRVNPLHAIFLLGKIKMYRYLQFVSFLHNDMAQVIEILPHVRQDLTYSTESISWVMMSCWCKEPGHHQPYLLCLTWIIQSLHVKGQCRLIFSLGGTPLGMYKKLIEFHKAGEISFKYVITFNMDEYVGKLKLVCFRNFTLLWDHNLLTGFRT